MLSDPAAHVSWDHVVGSYDSWVFMCALATMSILHVKAAVQDKVDVQSLLKIILGSLHANLHTS